MQEECVKHKTTLEALEAEKSRAAEIQKQLDEMHQILLYIDEIMQKWLVDQEAGNIPKQSLSDIISGIMGTNDHTSIWKERQSLLYERSRIAQMREELIAAKEKLLSVQQEWLECIFPEILDPKVDDNNSEDGVISTDGSHSCRPCL